MIREYSWIIKHSGAYLMVRVEIARNEITMLNAVTLMLSRKLQLSERKLSRSQDPGLRELLGKLGSKDHKS
jgi:hypothetical protein